MASLLPPWALPQVQLTQLASQQQCKAAHLQALVTMLGAAERLGGAVAAAVKASLLQPVLLQLLPHLQAVGRCGMLEASSSSGSSVAAGGDTSRAPTTVAAGRSSNNSTASTAAVSSSSSSSSLLSSISDYVPVAEFGGSSAAAASAGSSSSSSSDLDVSVSWLLLKLLDGGELH
jgi:hypothetical protein